MTATISLVAAAQPEGMIAAATRLRQMAAQREALAQLASGWQGDAVVLRPLLALVSVACALGEVLMHVVQRHRVRQRSSPSALL